MKSLLVLALLAFGAVLVSAHHLEMCEKSTDELREQLVCHRQHATGAFNAKLDQVNRQLRCNNDICTFKKLCDAPDFLTELRKYFTESEINELHELANQCDPDAHHDHPHCHPH
uniref:Antimicrobial peptide microplusin n=1 Tax=Argas monolakensis TaxID=34602 RepID=MPSIN_ARGMO|nr:RecName: Full=Antimicrobial peptide microplusin; Flags: Precursor [Argas monolakensis]ABI52699.1 microplusin-like antimicrobial [Argas monolakensis]